ncbi:hypothetical protein BDZ89DRAFT_1080461 [Hymenopellis radicata]|nr:hypothetical protein BDZ89DRAFT_1080461 [Hymenopellis radicata]
MRSAYKSSLNTSLRRAAWDIAHYYHGRVVPDRHSTENASDFAQVFFDVLNCHKWLYDTSRISHRDISLANIMYRFDDEGDIYGATGHRTGTPPFMTIDLLLNTYIATN